MKTHIFDSVGGEFDDIVARDPQGMVIKVPDDARENCLEPGKGVDPNTHIMLFLSVFCQAFGLLEASFGVILDALKDCYTGFGIFDGEDQYPTVLDLMKHIKTMSTRGFGRLANYKEACLNRLEQLWIAFEPMLSCSRGYPLDVLTNHNIVWDLSSLSAACQRFFITMLLEKIYSMRLAQARLKSGKLSFEMFEPLVFIVDEATIVFDRRTERNNLSGFPHASRILTQGRKARLSLVLSTQQPTQILTSAISESQNKIVFHLEDSRDVNEVGASLGLTPEMREFVHTGLEVGQAIVKTPRLKRPVFLQAPEPIQ